MADLPRTQAYLISAWAMTGLGLIDAQDGRDLIRSVFGWQSVSDPTANNDSADTAGLGVSFSIGSEWINTNAQHEFVCVDDRPGIAVWEPRGLGVADYAYIDSHDAATLVSANAHSDAGDAATLGSANAHSDAGDAATLGSANAHSDAADIVTLASANAHSDAADIVTLASANAHSDAADAVTLASANSFTTSSIAAIPGSLLMESGASAKISALPSAGALAGTEPLVCVQGGADKQLTIASLVSYIETVLVLLFYVWSGSLVTDTNESPYINYWPLVFRLTTILYGDSSGGYSTSGGAFA